MIWIVLCVHSVVLVNVSHLVGVQLEHANLIVTGVSKEIHLPLSVWVIRPIVGFSFHKARFLFKLNFTVSAFLFFFILDLFSFTRHGFIQMKFYFEFYFYVLSIR